MDRLAAGGTSLWNSVTNSRLKLAACVRNLHALLRLTPFTECHLNSVVWIKPKNRLPRQRLLWDRKNNFRLISRTFEQI